jgi:general secretion pathway protein A
MSGANQKLPTTEQIAERAHQRYVEHGCRNGNALADWLDAEKELLRLLNTDDALRPNSPPVAPQHSWSTSRFLEFFGLKEQPFGMTPDPAYLYASRTHSEALSSLLLGIADTRGFLSLIAEPGMGKTSLLYQLLEELRDAARTVLIFQTECTSREFIEYILQDLGVDVTGMGLVAMHGKLNEILFEQLLKGKRFVLVVDEAQNLDDSVLETVRMLSNFETHNAKLLQIILAGQPRLAAKLAQPRLSQLRQRIAVLSHLEPFNVEETRRYIDHRLKVAGYRGEPIFETASIRLVAGQSKGIPRNINNICHNALLLAYARGQHTVGVEVVQAAVARLDMESLAFDRPTVPTPEAVPVAVPVTVPVTVPASTTALVKAAASGAPGSATPSTAQDRPANSSLTYDADRKSNSPKLAVRSAILPILLLAGGTLLLAILGRSESRQRTPAGFDQSRDTSDPSLPADRSPGAYAGYDATPQEMDDGQLLTVAAGPQQTVKDLSLRYTGHFDSELAIKIRALNPDLKDPDHLEAGQLIRIPLPSGAMRKVHDTAEFPAPSKPETGNLLTKFSALLHERKPDPGN